MNRDEIDDLRSENAELEAEVERLKAVIAQEIDRYLSLAHHTGEIKSNNLDLRAEIERLRAHTWQQERAAVVVWMNDQERFPDAFPKTYSRRIERGEHWPEE